MVEPLADMWSRLEDIEKIAHGQIEAIRKIAFLLCRLNRILEEFSGRASHPLLRIEYDLRLQELSELLILLGEDSDPVRYELGEKMKSLIEGREDADRNRRPSGP